MIKKPKKPQLKVAEVSGCISFETFRKVGSYERSNLELKEPSCFNGFVSIKKYKITIEEVEEPKEVLAARLQEMWDKSDNHHNWQPLVNAAKSIGYEFTTGFGSKRVR